jgi:hypothetical protein
MASLYKHIFSANLTRAILTLGGTIAILGAVLYALNTNNYVIMSILTLVFIAGIYKINNNSLKKITIGHDKVELAFGALFTQNSLEIFDMLDIAGEYKSKAGPKGIPLMVLELRIISTNEVIAEIQPDLTGWKQADLIAISSLLKKPGQQY